MTRATENGTASGPAWSPALEQVFSSSKTDALLFSFLIDQIHDVIFAIEVVAEDQYRFIQANRRFFEATGLAPENVIGRLLDDVVPPASLPLVKQKYQQALRTGQTVRWDEASEYPTGTKVGEVTVRPIFWEQGHCDVLVGTVHDVTERHQHHQRLRELEERWRLALDASGTAAWDWDCTTNLVTFSEQWKTLFGFTRETLQLGRDSYAQLLHPDDLARVTQTLAQARAGALETFHCEARLRHCAGHWVWVHCRGKAIKSAQGKVVRVLGANLDISQAKAAEEAMQLASLVFERSSEAIAIFDRCARILTVNPAFSMMRGFAPAEVTGRTARLYSAECESVRGADADSYDAIWAQVLAAGHWKGELWSRHKDGQLIAEFRSINAVTAPDGTVRNYIEIASDITREKKSEELLWRQANYDSLTGLPNRHLFFDRLHQAIRNAQRGEAAFTLLYIDLDQFKEVNDTLGHSTGDRLLREAAQRLVGCTRETDTVCRLGGDEFTVLVTSLHNRDEQDPFVIDRIAQAIIATMTRPFRIDAEIVHISASIGITHFPKDATDIESLMKHADQAMYEAKRHGRNCYMYFSHSMQERAQLRRRLLEDLRFALKHDELQVHYQPIVQIATGRIVKAEALLRWHHPQRGWISPAQFIPLCEDTDLILEIGEWVFHQAVADAARWLQAPNRRLQLGVNVSPTQLIKGGDSCRRCMEYLQSKQLPRSTIVIEVTEGSLLRDERIVNEQLGQLGYHGVALAIDDFGTGYSALSYLQRYRFSFLKIDRSFVQNLGGGTTNLALCETIILMAHKLGMQVVAEGIETEQEAALLAEAGCDFGQGFFFHKPLPAAAFEQLFLAQSCF